LNLSEHFNGWTLFLDRDGVINHKLSNDYVKNWDEFTFISGSLEAIVGFSNIFSRIFIVTNQRGVGLGLMTEAKLNEIHDRMLSEFTKVSGRVDRIYYCTATDLSAECRKPNIGMGLKAKNDFPEIEFSKSVMIGDSISDIEFGKKLGMKCVFCNDQLNNESLGLWDFQFKSLSDFYLEILGKNIKN
jgi:D-glycero-D-manno-heptose 1,7-bisphosphate phosphatase